MENTVLEATTLLEKETEMITMCHHEANEGKVFVVIEGTDDEKIYSRFLDDLKVTFYVTGNCLHVVELVRNLNRNPSFENRLIGVKDADFDHILHRSYSGLDNLFLTDCHDIEMTILSDDFENSLKAEYRLSHTTLLTDKVAEDLKNLSYLRLYNEVAIVSHGLDGINFNDITYSVLYDGENAVGMQNCLDHVKLKCNNARLGHFPIAEMVERVMGSYENSDLRQLTRGHDLIYALQVRLAKISGHDSWGYKNLCLMLRCSCTKEKFEGTKLYRDLNAWMNGRNLHLWKVA